MLCHLNRCSSAVLCECQILVSTFLDSNGFYVVAGARGHPWDVFFPQEPRLTHSTDWPSVVCEDCFMFCQSFSFHLKGFLGTIEGEVIRNVYQSICISVVIFFCCGVYGLGWFCFQWRIIKVSLGIIWLNDFGVFVENQVIFFTPFILFELIFVDFYWWGWLYFALE